MNYATTAPDQVIEQLQKQLSDVFATESFMIAKSKIAAIIFRGKLLTDSDAAFATIRPRFESLGYTPMLEHARGQDVVTAMPGLIQVRESNPLINLALFVLTVISTFIAGAYYGIDGSLNVTNGILFAASILTILGAHELGHYFVARHYHAPVTLPYFIPLPLVSPIGTLGAVIRLKAPFLNRKSLFDVGIAGPLAGLAFAIPILWVGLSMSQVVPPIPCPSGGCQEGNSIFYALAKLTVFGQFLPGGGQDVLLSPIAWAAWVGLFVTALNLLPAGQLDGGHIAFALLGRQARYLGWATVAGLIVLMIVLQLFFVPYWGWLIWVLLIYVTGVDHPIPLNDISDLGLARKILGVFAWFLFIILFPPLPFS